MDSEKRIKLTFSPNPSLVGGEVRRTEVFVNQDETMKDILERVKMLLCIWLRGVGNKTEKEYQLCIEGGDPIDLKYTPKELHLVDGQVLFVNLKKEVLCKPLNSMVEEGTAGDVFPSSDFLKKDLFLDSCYLSHNNVQMPTEEDILRFEEAKKAALVRAREIERIKGINYVSHRKILHDEAVEDYDEEDFGDYEYFEDVGYDHEETEDAIIADDGEYDFWVKDKEVSNYDRYPNSNESENNRGFSRNNPLCPFK